MYGRSKLKRSGPKSDASPEEIGPLEIRKWFRRLGISASVPDECSQAAKRVVYRMRSISDASQVSSMNA